MRLLLLPISTRRSLLYCQRINKQLSSEQSYADKITSKAAKVWAGWEAAEKGWKKKVVVYGNTALKRIPYEEWALKSIPPLSARRKAKELDGKEKVELEFPSTIIPKDKVEGVLRSLATERQLFHKKKLLWSIAVMPLTIPVALIPM